MKKSVIALITTLLLGYLGMIVGVEYLGGYFEEFGCIVSIAVIGMFIVSSLEKNQQIKILKSNKSNKFIFGISLMFTGFVCSSTILGSTMYTPQIYSYRYPDGWFSCVIESKLIFPLIFFIIMSLIGLYISIKELKETM